jgi:hypothetical protein
VIGPGYRRSAKAEGHMPPACWRHAIDQRRQVFC